MERIGDAIGKEVKDGKHAVFPKSEDVQVILRPKRLRGRKDMLRDILVKCFHLRGKCVPNLNLRDGDLLDYYLNASPDDIDGYEDRKFVTQCSVKELGTFAIYKLLQHTKSLA